MQRRKFLQSAMALCGAALVPFTALASKAKPAAASKTRLRMCWRFNRYANRMEECRMMHLRPGDVFSLEHDYGGYMKHGTPPSIYFTAKGFPVKHKDGYWGIEVFSPDSISTRFE